ncbi:MAG: ABC transporter ATP-binding protein/permease [Fibrobacter sp.]|nr:ABC transporter ATP-binding protein/permease [Fibrobacter sp.]
MKYVAWLWRSTVGIRGLLVLRVVLGVLRVALGLYVILLSKRFIDETIRTGSDGDVIRMAGLLLLAVFAGVVIRQVNSYLGTAANIKKTNEIRIEFFGCLFERKLFGEKVLLSGDVTSRMSKDVEQISGVMTEEIPQTLITLTQLVGAFLMMRWFDAKLAWALLLLTVSFAFFGKLIARTLRKMTLDIRKEESSIQMRVQEAVEHNAVLRSMGSENWLRSELNALQARLKMFVLKRARFTVSARLFIGTAFSLGYMLAFVWGGIGLRNGVITFGVMTSFLQLVMQIQHPILTLLNMVPQLIHATASIDRLEELRSNSALDHEAHRIAVPENGTAVELQNVSFKYAGDDHLVLQDFSRNFKTGSKTAIMGETGAGKTTLFRLMLGLVDPTSGVVVANKQDFSFVPQGNSLLSGTIRYNLQVANPGATDEQMLVALRISCAEFVGELPNGLDSELGERGVGLSEGQAQRVAIARGLLHPGNILLLDEISSSLDESTERELYRRLFDAYPHKTMIFITHRPAVCELCDEVIHLS